MCGQPDNFTTKNQNIANIISLTSPKITLTLMFITGLLELIFTLRKTGPAKAGAAGLFLLAMINALEITLATLLIQSSYYFNFNFEITKLSVMINYLSLLKII